MRRWQTAPGFLAGCVLLAAISQLLTRPDAGRCALDGVPIQPVYSVEAYYPNREKKVFGSVTCAVAFLKKEDHVTSLIVHDEITGRGIAADRAFYIRSHVITVPAAGNDIHVFASWKDALIHIEAYDGEAVANPFQPWLRED